MTEVNLLNTATGCSARRTFLATVTAGAVALAGCTSSSESGPGSENQSTESSETFEAVVWEGPDLVATLASDASVSHVDLVGPDDETVARYSLREDDPDLTFTLLGEGNDGYTPGEHRLVATDGESPIEETSLSLEPNLAVTDVVRGADEPGMDWDKDVSTWEDHAAIVIENTGNAPTFLESTTWTNAPLAKVTGTDAVDYYHDVLVPAGETKTVYSPGPVYQAQDHASGRDLECDDLETETLTVTVASQAGPDPSFSQTIEYGGELRSCELNIIDGDQGDDEQSPSADDGE